MSNSSVWDNSTISITDHILLTNFDRDVFMEVMVVYAAPCIVALIVRTHIYTFIIGIDHTHVFSQILVTQRSLSFPLYVLKIRLAVWLYIRVVFD
jgi:hypothetical protein